MTDRSSELRLGLWRMAFAGAATLTLLYVLCWAAAAAGVPYGHMWIELFTAAPVDSVDALVQGVLWSIVIGVISGASLAFFYNGFGRRRA